MTRIFLAIVLATVGTFTLGVVQWPTAHAHDLQIIVPVYFRASDQLDRQVTMKPKINSLMSEATSFFSSAHLSSGDSIRVNAAIVRTGSQPKSWYCNGASPCVINSVYARAISDLSNPASSGYVGWNITAAKNIITLVFFDDIPSGDAGIATATNWRSHYNPEGLAGYALFGEYVLESSATIGTAGHDGTIAHEIGHTLRLPHNTDNGLSFGSCALMGSNQSWCWPNSAFLVDTLATDGRWYLEKQAVHWSSFTSPVGAPFSVLNQSVSMPTCGQRTLSWSPPPTNITQQVLMVAPRGSRLAGSGGAAIRVDRIYFGETTQIYYLSATASSYTVSSLSPWTSYHWEVATVNGSGHVHAWPDSSGFVTAWC